MPARTLVLALALLCACASAMQMSKDEETLLEEMGIKGEPMGRKNMKPQAEIMKADLKYIRCNVCRKMVEMAYDKAEALLAKRFSVQKKRKNEQTEFDGEGAVLVASDDALHVVNMPLALLPPGVAVGHVIDMNTARSIPAEQTRDREIRNVQAELQARLGSVGAGAAMSAHDVLSS